MVIYMGDTDHTFPKPGQGVLLCVLPQNGVERVDQEQAALACLLFGKKAGHDYLQDAVFKTDFYAVNFSGFYQIFCLGNRGGGIEEAPELTGDPFGPQGGFG